MSFLKGLVNIINVVDKATNDEFEVRNIGGRRERGRGIERVRWRGIGEEGGKEGVKMKKTYFIHSLLQFLILSEPS